LAVVRPGRPGSVRVAVRNDGEPFPPRTTLLWTLILSDNPAASATGQTFDLDVVYRRVELPPGKVRTFTLRFRAPSSVLAALSYLVIHVGNDRDEPESDPSDNSLALPATVA
jgi:hypothetical protein